MSKRRRSGDEINVIIPNKQICLHNVTSKKPTPVEYPPNGDNNPPIPMELGENEHRSEKEQIKAPNKKETPAGELKKGRRRTSGRWDFHGGSIRDPLNLKNVKPEEPSTDEVFAKKVAEEPKKENKFVFIRTFKCIIKFIISEINEQRRTIPSIINCKVMP